MEVSSSRWMWPGEPPRVDGQAFDELLAHCVAMEASDVTVKAGRPALAKVHGTLRRVTNRALALSEVGEILSWIFKSDSALAQINGASPLDFAYCRAGGSRGERSRFRVNAVSCAMAGGAGIHLTLRPIPSEPPLVANMGIEPELLGAMASARAMVVVSGPTGSGKTTLLAGAIRWMLEKPGANCKVMTCEDPIEFDLEECGGDASFAVQTEVGKHIGSYKDGVRNALRQNASAMLIGEVRDAPTADACVDAAITGHLTMTTTHAQGVPETLRRLITLHPEPSQAAKAVELVSSLSLIVSQRLVPSLDGRRIALREFLAFDAAVKEDLLSGPVSEMARRSRVLTRSRGQTFYAAGLAAFNAVKIGKAEFALLRDEERASQGL